MAETPGEFAGALREQRKRARMTQQELADAAGVSLRTVSDLERGVATTPQRETVRLLGDALSLIGVQRARFETAARGRPLEAVPAAAALAMRSLPRDVASFTGRQRELDQLTNSALAAGGVVGIHAIGGMAGVGKTAFAVHAAHRLAARFPGGQIFLPLHGHTPGQQPVAPADALASLLLATGVSPAQIPHDIEARAALWRDRVADKPLLLVLDDAAGSEQVQLLLPGTGGSLVLVTSRRHLSALDDAITLSLDTLPPGDAAALLVRLAGRPGLSPGDPGVGEISGLCGYLPLAVGMMARQLRHHPAWTAAGRAAELASARDRLGLMETENLSVAAAFDLSYADLTEDQQRLFRYLGLHPGTDVDGYAAAALVGNTVPDGRRGLEALYDQYLLTEPAQGRYRLHDLLREHARALADRLDPYRNRDAAVDRLLDYYQHTAATANSHITRRLGPVPTADGGQPGSAPALTDQRQALAWARAERANLLNCLDHAAAVGQRARVTALTAGVSGLLLCDGPWVDAVARHTAAVAAAQQLGDQLSEANALCDLGSVRRLAHDYQNAVRAYEHALEISRALGDRLGEANALSGLGAVLHVMNDHQAAALAQEQALAVCGELGDRFGQGKILNALGQTRYMCGDYRAAARAQQEALGICRESDDRLGQARVLMCLAEVRLMTGEYPAALLAVEESLGINRELGDRLGQAQALQCLADVRLRTREYPAAARALEETLSISRDLGNRLGQANTLILLGGLRQQTGDYPGALSDLEESLRIALAIGYPVGRGNALLHLGSVRRLTGDYLRAAQELDQALDIYRGTGDRSGAAEALNERGALHRVCGEPAAARDCHQRSLELSREIASPWDEAHALAGLGRCALAEDDAQRGEDLLRQALRIFEHMRAPEAQDVLSELDALTSTGPTR
ncbi:tetratricopeptide repeat protein [Streptacidiphilus sp. P02-A3a]|uniref:ATP-binding protein n=1 Tax=Streptacidiphilus sp. P02-A3a TaxID=2704468 RepID=UPI0015FE147F|nr:helix-turn-helix transcriptional regulator [Streptacidiphilus sp. P02-A3a]QMU69811.1 tetratricopeptide repeat protein [Streptacidiphilus sp. P02-A3a]